MIAGNIPAETVRPRTWQQKPGDRLILVPDAAEWMRRVEEFERTLGDGQREFTYYLPAFATPLYERHPEGPAGIPLNVAWHPIFWLPSKLAAPLPDEPDGEWAYRVCQAFIEHGVYVPEDGTWMDVLAWLGLNVDHPIDRSRIQTWLAGTSSDPLLDGIDWETVNGLYPATPLTDHVSHIDAITGYSQYEEAQWALTAHSLVGMVADELEELSEEEAAAKATALFDRLAPIVLMTLADAPEAIEGWGTIWDSVALIGAELREPGADTLELLGDLVSQIVTLHERYAPSLQEILDEESAIQDEQERGLQLESIPDGS